MSDGPIESYSDFIRKLGGRIKAERVSLGFLQEDVAELLGMTRVAIGYIEQGRRSPKMKTLFELANLYEVDVRVFFDFLDSSETPPPRSKGASKRSASRLRPVTKH